MWVYLLLQADRKHSYSQSRRGCPHCGLSSNVYTTVFLKSQHPYCTRQSLGPNSRLSGEGSRFLAAIRGRMAESTVPGFKFQDESVRKQVARRKVWSFRRETRYVFWSGRWCDAVTSTWIVLLSPMQIYPIIGSVISAWFKALDTAHFLHRRVSILQ